MAVDHIWPDGAVAPESLVSFDGGSRVEASVQRPDRYGFFHASQQAVCSIPRGAGLSFSDASFGPDAVTVDLRAFNRILDFDATNGVVEVEMGLSLGELFHFLKKRDFYLPVQP
jgi:decaprenylphospho-beta-D-ribofuranose 2-oxidase